MARAPIAKVALAPVASPESDAADAVASLVEQGALTGRGLVEIGERAIDWAIAGMLPKRGTMLLLAPEKIGKSGTAHALVKAICFGGDFLGRAVTRSPHPALLITPDLPRADVARRMRAIARGAGIAFEELADRLVVYDRPIALVPASERDRLADAAWNQTTRDAMRVHDPKRRADTLRSRDDAAAAAVGGVAPGVDALATIESGQWSIIVVDALADCLPAGMTENDARAATLFAQCCRDLAEQTGAIVVVIHHTSRAGEGSRAGRGSTAWPAKFDAIVTMTRQKDGSAKVEATLRHGPSPVPMRLALRVDGGEVVGVDVSELVEREDEPAKGRAGAVTAAEVADVLRAASPRALAITRIRTHVSAARGGKRGSKSDPRSTRAAVDELVRAGKVARCGIAKVTPDAWRWGTDDTPDEATHDEDDDVADDADPSDPFSAFARGKKR